MRKRFKGSYCALTPHSLNANLDSSTHSWCLLTSFATQKQKKKDANALSMLKRWNLCKKRKIQQRPKNGLWKNFKGSLQWPQFCFSSLFITLKSAFFKNLHSNINKDEIISFIKYFGFFYIFVFFFFWTARKRCTFIHSHIFTHILN